MTSNELKEKYLKFFEKQGHKIIPSASLIPENDPTVLFTTAGMHPLVPYLLGEKHPAGQRLVDVQKCIRTSDIDEVGDNSHLTFFEMLGNWSLGDYWKKEAITWSFKFLTEELGIPLAKLAVSCFAGDADAPKDEESALIWQALGIKPERIAHLSRTDNWWGPAGNTGPCGPDTEMFYWTGSENPPENFDGQDSRWLEIWNDVFMQYTKTADGRYEPLAQKNVDTGMGLERTIAVLNGDDNVFASDLFKPIIEKIKGLATKPNEKSIRIIADHVRSATFILGDQKGITPSNLDQGYVLRRLIRRAIRHGKMIGIDKPFTFEIAKIVVEKYSADYPELKKNQGFIEEQLAREEEKFSQTLEKGIKEFEKISAKNISGQEAFVLFSTYGFPLEMTEELAKERGIEVDRTDFKKEFAKHQKLSRTATEGKFKGGLADNSAVTARLHTAAHLMLAALRQVLGESVYQKGSNITPERIRFDFSYDKKMTPEEIEKVETIVNEQISKKIPITGEELDLAEAKKRGAMGVFENKYGDKVKVYSIGDFSSEICGGPHAKNTNELGRFKIIKEESSSAGVRRIKAILE
ncbi:MAG: alanine--tRNA ligase [Patescibacteria group bacterium]